MKTLLLLSLACLFVSGSVGGPVQPPAAGEPPATAEAPLAALQPKAATGVDRFLAAHPEYDGRGVVVAIFDTGVDPGAPGLQTTSDGKPKIIDMIDGSGSGDVDTSTVRAVKDGVVEGLTGRTLHLPGEWQIKDGKVHLGLKRAYEIYPGGLVRRIRARRREAWDAAQRAAVSAAERALADFDTEHPKPTADELKTRQDLQDRIDALDAMQKHYDDPGPIYDCVVFHDGQTWRAAIDTDEDGELGDEKLLTNYAAEHQYATFGQRELLNYALNIYEDGDLLSIVTDTGAHGTHVAGIVSAYYPEQPQLNGIAPGAQIVAVKIGDTRMQASSMGTGEVRGVIAALADKVDLINMSFGGPTPDPDSGRIIDIYSEAVNRYGIIWVASAGNSGPALSTVGGPGGTTTALFGVGAVVTPEMMTEQYSLRRGTREMQYTWSSRGPTFDGALGVKFSAPGGAISPVPNWVLQRNMLMNGTSMASPNVCGGIALLLSACKAESVPYTPQRVRRALENTAKPLEDQTVFAQGRGVVQIDAAYDYLKQYTPYTDKDLRFDVRVPSRDNARGFYLREPFETERVLETNVRVRPLFHHDADNREKVDFELHIRLECDERWVEIPDELVLMHGGRSFGVRIDPRRLEHGVHYAEILGYDADQPERGPLFRVPITVVRPRRLDPQTPTWEGQARFKPGQIQREMFAVPPGATWADIELTAAQAETPRRMVLHTMETLPGRAFNVLNKRDYIWLSSGQTEVRTIPVVGGRTLEVCLAQYWSNLGEGAIDARVTFHGLRPEPDEVLLADGQYSAMVDVLAPLRKEEVRPAATLTTWRRALRPRKFDLRPLDGTRDRLPEERQIYSLVLTYDLSQPADGRLAIKPALTNDEDAWNSWESLMWQVTDKHNRLIRYGSNDTDPFTLEKGEYILRFHVRSTDLDGLERLEDMPIWIDRTLGSAISLKIYDDPDKVLGGGRTYGTRTFQRGQRDDIYIAAPPRLKLPEQAKPGDRLVGTLTLGAADDSLPGAGRRPGGFPLTMVIPPPPSEKPKPKPAKAEPADKPDPLAKLAEDVRDLKVKRLASLHGEADAAAFDKLAGEILAEYPDYLPVFVERLHRADEAAGRRERLEAVVKAADEVIGRIDQDALAAEFGRKLDSDDDAAAKARREAEKQKETLVDALYRKGRALALMLLDDDGEPIEPGDESGLSAEQAGETGKRLDATVDALAQWIDEGDKRFVSLSIDHERLRGRLGTALKLLNGRIAKDESNRDLLDQRLQLLRALGWRHWAEYERKWLTLRFPPVAPGF